MLIPCLFVWLPAGDDCCDAWDQRVPIGAIITASRGGPNKRKVPSFFAFFWLPKRRRSFDRFL